MVVYDAHSIRSHIPHLFEGELPQFNLGTAGPSGAPDTSCDNALSDVVENLLALSGMSQVRNGRFKGGWITRAEEFMAPRYRLSEAEHRQRTSAWA